MLGIERACAEIAREQIERHHKKYRRVFEWDARGPMYWRDVGTLLTLIAGFQMMRQVVGRGPGEGGAEGPGQSAGPLFGHLLA